MFARIEHELAEREALELQRQELQKRKNKLIADNKRRKDDLANLDKDLETFIDVSSHRTWGDIFETDNLAGGQTYPGVVREGSLSRQHRSINSSCGRPLRTMTPRCADFESFSTSQPLGVCTATYQPEAGAHL